MTDGLDDFAVDEEGAGFLRNPKIPLGLIGGFTAVIAIGAITLAIMTDPSDRYPKPEIEITENLEDPGLESGFTGEDEEEEDDLFADDGEAQDEFEDGDLFADGDDGTDEDELFADDDAATDDEGDLFADDDGDDISDTTDGGDGALFADDEEADFDPDAGEEGLEETLTAEKDAGLEGQIASAEALAGRNPLPPAPFKELIEATPNGPLPIIGEDGLQPWQAYARPFDDETDRPRIAVVILDLGMMQDGTVAAIRDMPGEITLGFIPYARNMEYWVQQSRMAGHEIMLQVPMEPYGYPDNDPGPHTLLSEISGTENRKRLEWLLGRFPGYVGITNFMGSKFMTKSVGMKSVAKTLKDRGLLFVEARKGDNSVAGAEMRLKNVPYRLADGIIDEIPSAAAINQRLSDLEVLAKRRGEALAIARARPVTIRSLKTWLDSLRGKNMILAPVSALAKSGGDS